MSEGAAWSLVTKEIVATREHKVRFYMSEKVDFKGDVSQAVMGDVVEAPRLSNVVNLSLNEVKKEVQLITDYQRKRINILVKEWAAICGDKELDIYKIFIADFGLRKFRQLPME